MNKFKRVKIIFFIIIAFTPFFSSGQAVDTLVKYGEFLSVNQDIWGNGGDFSLNINKELFRLNWNNSGKNGGIKTLAGMKFGGEIDASTWGDIGSNFILNGFTSGATDVYYPFNVKYIVPDSATYTVGEKITIKTDYNVLSSSFLNIQNPSGGIAELRMHVGFGFDVLAKLCLFGCVNMHLIPDVNLPIQEFYLFKADSSGLVYPCRYSNYSCSDYDDPSTCTYSSSPSALPGFCKKVAAPYNIIVPGSPISGSVELPYNGLITNSNLIGKSLYASGEFKYVTLTTDLFATLSLIPIPVVSTVLGNLSNTINIGNYGKVSYNLFDLDFPIINYHKHRFSFSPIIYNKLQLSTKVNYSVFDNNGVKIEFGKDSLISYPLESEVEVEIPCNSAFVDVVNYDFEIGNSKNFSNHTYDSLSFEVAMSALEFSIKIPEVEVLPKICFPQICIKIPYPCPTWGKPWKWCSKTSCTPAFCTPSISYDGFDFGVGPLWDYNEQLAATKFDWYKDSWELGGFSPYMDSSILFRLYPTEYKVELSKTDVLCYGDSTGKINASISGGTEPYSLEWSNGKTNFITFSKDSVTNIPAGSYYLIITDKNNCQVLSSIEINQPDYPLSSAFVNIENVKCFGNSTASIDLTTEGGTAPYSFAWNNSNMTFNASTEDINNISAGNYFVTITDNHGCSYSDNISISQPTASLSSEITSQNVLCHNGNSAYADVKVKGGTIPYSYLWSNSDTSKKTESLTKGTYYLTITDNNNCIKKDTVVISEPQPISLSETHTNVSCFGKNDGNINLTTTGGTSPFSYLWSNSKNQYLTQKTEDIGNLEASNYHVIAKDENECIDTLSIKIDQPTELKLSFVKNDISCFGSDDGFINTKISGGVLPYTYNWSNGEITKNITNLIADEYIFEITDSNQCTVIDSVKLTQPSGKLQVAIKSTDVLCFGDKSGKITIETNGGTSPYSYTWSNGDSTANLNNLSAGTYTISIEDANNCKTLSGTVINEPESALDFSTTVIEASCFGYKDGSIEINPSGGTAPYYFRWDDSTLLINENFEILNHLYSGIYRIIVRDNNDCLKEQFIDVSQPDSITLGYITDVVSCFNGSDGAINISINGGTSPYDFNWSTGDKTEDISQLSAGIYEILVMDNKDCKIEESIEVSQFSQIMIDYEISEISCN
ncbi:MAG: SprB repeat-containing protein, partial [Bacteroidota bacterium]|nr:SprB repeat-containing protein [Bacteroidota bacterium]